MSSEFEAKIARVRAWMDERGVGTLLLSRLDNLFWLGCGLDAHVGLAAEQAVGTLLITATQVALVTTNIEADRLHSEETADLPIEIVAVPWYGAESTAHEIARRTAPGGRVAADTPGAEHERVDLAPLRAELLPAEVGAYRALGADHGAALGAAARAVQPGWSEFEAAAALSRELLSRGITPTVLLVAADERIARYRHPIPTARRVERTVMLVAGGRRRGLICSATRLVRFGPCPTDLARRHAAVCSVDSTFIAHTRPGVSVAAIFGAALAAYGAAGYPEEWRLHHQGGATGYAGREYRATPDSKDIVRPWQAFAWNPSIAGTKSEDTILATADGPEVLTASPDWPLLASEVAGRAVGRPAILER